MNPQAALPEVCPPPRVRCTDTQEAWAAPGSTRPLGQARQSCVEASVDWFISVGHVGYDMRDGRAPRPSQFPWVCVC